jgi:hypothetical protein
MKPRVPLTFEEMLKAPEGVWHKLPGGFEVEEAYDFVEADTQRIVVSLPKRAIRAFRPKPRERLSARVADGKLIIERAAAKRPKRQSKRSA